jgi:hypothetical protein
MATIINKNKPAYGSGFELGITKRELFAMDALMAILTTSVVEMKPRNIDDAIRQAVLLADGLLDKLEQTK